MLTTACAMRSLQPVTYEHPPEGLARGRFPVPWWALLALAATIVLAAAVFLIVRGVVGWRLSKGPSRPPTNP